MVHFRKHERSFSETGDRRQEHGSREHGVQEVGELECFRSIGALESIGVGGFSEASILQLLYS